MKTLGILLVSFAAAFLIANLVPAGSEPAGTGSGGSSEDRSDDPSPVDDEPAPLPAASADSATVIADLEGLEPSAIGIKPNRLRFKIHQLIARLDGEGLFDVFLQSKENAAGGSAFWETCRDLSLEQWTSVDPVSPWATLTGDIEQADQQSLHTAGVAFLIASPQEFLTELGGSEDELRGTMINSLMQVISTRGTDRPLAEIQRFLENSEAEDLAALRERLPSLIANAVAKLPYSEAVAWLDTLPEGASRDGAAKTLFRQLAKSQPSRIPELVRDLFPDLNPRDRRLAATFAASSWARKDPQAALEWIGTLPEEMRGKVKRNTLFSLSDSAAATEETLRSFAPGDIPRGMVADIARNLFQGEGAAKETLEWIDSLPEGLRDGEKSDYVQSLVRSDPSKAAELALEGLIPMSSTIAAQLASRDPAAALEWASQVASPELRNDFERIVFGQWADTDPQAAAQSATQLPPGEGREKVISGVAHSWALNNWEEAFAWTSQLQGEERLVALRTVLSYPTNVERASAEIVNAITTTPELGADQQIASASERVVRQLVWENPSEASEWVAQLPDGPAREAAISAAANEWAIHDPPGASEWLAGLEPSPGRDSAVQSLVANIKEDPERAFLWAGYIGDSEMRLAALEEVTRDWHGLDPDTARQVIQEAEIAPEERVALINLLNSSDIE